MPCAQGGGEGKAAYIDTGARARKAAWPFLRSFVL
jgi:hypothetical protein